jgi:hypothetical protein
MSEETVMIYQAPNDATREDLLTALNEVVRIANEALTQLSGYVLDQSASTDSDFERYRVLCAQLKAACP